MMGFFKTKRSEIKIDTSSEEEVKQARLKLARAHGKFEEAKVIMEELIEDMKRLQRGN